MGKLKSARLDIRLTKEQKKLLEYAASLEGKGLTDFIITAVQKYALDSIDRYEATQKILASKEDKKVFFEALANPPEPNNALLKAFDDYKLNFGDFEKTDGTADEAT